VEKDPLGNPVDPRHPWNQSTLPHPQKRDFTGKYTWVMSPRWYDKQSGKHLALDTGGGPLARFWATALAGLVDIGYVKATGTSVKMVLPKTALLPEVELEWTIPRWSNAIERDRTRPRLGTRARATTSVPSGRTRTRSRTRRSSRRTARASSRASTSCARCAASIRACRAACTCIWGRGRSWWSGTRLPSERRSNE